MSVENVVGFLQKMAEDESLRASLNGLDKEHMLAFAHRQGFEFSSEELRQVCSAVASNQELDEEALDGVAGGMNLNHLLLGSGVVGAVLGGLTVAGGAAVLAYKLHRGGF